MFCISQTSQFEQAFPEHPITTIQLVVTLPSLIAIFSGLIVSKLAYKFYKKHLAIFFTVLYMLSGMLPVFFHDNIYQLLFSAGMVGVWASGNAAGFVGPLIMGKIYKATGDYRTAFVVAAVFAVVGLVLSFLYQIQDNKTN